MNNETWYPLETSAKIYPAIISPRQPSVFRLSCTFNEEIDPDILQTALNVTITRYPGFCMTLKRGAFWFYFEVGMRVPYLPQHKKLKQFFFVIKSNLFFHNLP